MKIREVCMNAFKANIISLSILAANAIVLFAFTKVILERFKIRLIRYVLGTIFAYGVLMYLLYLSTKYEFIPMAFQKARFRFFASDFTDVGMVPIVIPALYSVFLVGYFEKDRDWKKVRVMMLSVFVNGIFAFVGAMMYYSYLKGDSLQTIFVRLKASAEFIDWGYNLLFIAVLMLFYFVMKWDYFKHHKK